MESDPDRAEATPDAGATVTGLHRLRASEVELLVEVPQLGLPRIVHWGADLGPMSSEQLRAVAMASVPQVTSYVPDDPVPLAVLPEHGTGYFGWPGISGSRNGAAWSPLFTCLSADRHDNDSHTALATALAVRAQDQDSELEVSLDIEMLASGLVRMRAALTNTSDGSPYAVDAMHLTLPVPPVADELLDLTGRHTRERSPQRQPFNVGTRLRESRRGHGGHDASLVLVAGTHGFGFRHGEVWAAHVAWSGNHRIYAERLPTGGHALLGAGELLLPGEVELTPRSTYTSPWIYGSYARHGLDEMSHRFHDYLRSRPTHPTRRQPRPVILNTWEAVYFDVDPDALTRLADAAAEVGVERFVLDDGWFHGRRGESAGLGDWYVDASVWPHGLTPLIDHVQALGMQFGLWVEPESISPDSDIARAHPDWMLAAEGRTPPMSRLQQVLDLSQPEAFGHILSRLDDLLRTHTIDYLKWDRNRDVTDGGNQHDGRPAIHRNTRAVYALLDELRARHPRVEIESCAGGGGRIDLEILQRTDRVWASDSNDPLERQQIQRWTGLLLPPELVGAHVGAPLAHTTDRTHTIDFAAGTALFGHFGLELDLGHLTAAERADVAAWVALYKQVRHLIHSGDTVRSDRPEPSLWLHGVVSKDRAEAIYSVVGMQTTVTQPPGLLRLPGLDETRTYRVRLLEPGHHLTPTRALPIWTRAAEASGAGMTISGKALTRHGVQAPFMLPGSLWLLHVQDVST